MEALHTLVAHLMQFFTFEHLPPHLQEVSKLFAEAAAKLAPMTTEEIQAELALIECHQSSAILSTLCREVDAKLPPNVESTWAVTKITQAANLITDGEPMENVLRRLLEAKDCAVRGLLAK